MASSGSFNTNGYEGRYLTFSWRASATDVTKNQTTIDWELKGAGTGQVGWYESGNFKVVVDGVTLYSSATRIKLYNGTVVASGSFKLPHNSAGNRSFTAYAEAGVYYYAVNCSGSETFTLDPIPRASQPSCITWPEHTQHVGNFGDEISIHMNRKSDAFTHTVRYQFGSRSGTIATNVGTGTTWVIPKDLMNLIPNSRYGSGTIYVDTYNGSTKIGDTKSCGFTANVPDTADMKPKCSMTLEDITGVDDIYGSPVQGLSRIKVKVSATQAYSSPIKSYSIQIDGDTYTAASATTGALRKAGSSLVTVEVTDGRGETGSATYTMKVQSYAKPRVTKLSVNRCDEDGTDNDQGLYVRATFSSELNYMEGKNTATYLLRYKKTADSSWQTVELASLQNLFKPVDYTHIFPADDSSSYDVELTATDRHYSTTRATTASTAFSLIDFHKSGKGLRFGGVAEEDNTIQNDLSLKQMGNRYTFSTPGVAGTAGFICMARIKVIAANADTPITFVLSRRQAESTMTVHVQLSNSTATTSSVGSVRYEGSNYGAFLTPGGDALTWDLYVQKGSNYDTITIQDWWMSRTMEDRAVVTFPGGLVDTVPTPYWRAGPLIAESILDCFFPVGFVLILYSHADPNAMYPGTTWVRIANSFLWGIDANGEVGVTGGEKTHALTVAELPSHTHGSVYSGNASGTKTHSWLASGGSNMAYGTVATGSGTAHNNMPPYTQVSIWRRIA